MGGSRVYVGVDVHKNLSFVCAMKENGEVILEKKVRTEELEKFLENIENKTIILEPTTTGINLARKLRKNNEVLLSHPYKTKLIAESKKKTDKVDARVLADLARTNFLPTAYLPPDEIMELGEIIRERIRLKKTVNFDKEQDSFNPCKEWNKVRWKSIHLRRKRISELFKQRMDKSLSKNPFINRE